MQSQENGQNPQFGQFFDNFEVKYPVFLTQIVSHRQKNASVKVALLISHQQKWKSCWQFSKNCIFPNIQLKGVVNKLLQFKNLYDHTIE